MLTMKRGCKVPFSEKLEEAYMFTEKNVITANIDVNNIEAVMQHFIVMHEEPLFFILELPASSDDENEIRSGELETLHKNIYYIDGLTQEDALTIMNRAGEILFHDGLSSFGYGGHESGDEILFGKYNVLTVFSKNAEQYDAFFNIHNIKKVPHLVTAWDTFSEETPGESELITVNGENIYAIPEKFKEWGIYLAEQREER